MHSMIYAQEYIERLIVCHPEFAGNSSLSFKERVGQYALRQMILGHPKATVLPSLNFARALNVSEPTLFRYASGRKMIDYATEEAQNAANEYTDRHAISLLTMKLQPEKSAPFIASNCFLGMPDLLMQNGADPEACLGQRNRLCTALTSLCSRLADARPSEIASIVNEQMNIQSALDGRNLVESATKELRHFLGSLIA